ncbi:hypothetical protein AAVH_30011, partial [Aphelenchoides avenae]
MSKRPHDSQAPAPASTDLVEHLRAAANNPVLLREVVKGSDTDCIAAAFAALLADAAPTGSKLRKK